MLYKGCVFRQKNEVSCREYGIPSLELKLEHNLRKCAHNSRGTCLRKGELRVDK